MPQNELVQFLAVILLICCVFVFFVDVGTELQLRIAIRLKWGLAWVAARYTGIVSGVLLAVDIILYKPI